jgi:hypothetical protein
MPMPELKQDSDEYKKDTAEIKKVGIAHPFPIF